MFWDPLILTFQLAFVTTALLAILSIPVAYWLAYGKSRWKPVIEALISMPIILPPTVIGFYLLIAFSPGNVVGRWLEQTIGLRLVFSFEGLVLASIIYSLPFMIHPIKSGLTNLPEMYREAAYAMGKGRLSVLFQVLLPNIKSSLLTGIILTFAHTIGEFGVVLMIGGSLPGETRVASIAIYEEVEAMNYAAAHQYSLILFSITFFILLVVFMINGRWSKGLLK